MRKQYEVTLFCLLLPDTISLYPLNEHAVEFYPKQYDVIRVKARRIATGIRIFILRSIKISISRTKKMRIVERNILWNKFVLQSLKYEISLIYFHPTLWRQFRMIYEIRWIFIKGLYSFHRISSHWYKYICSTSRKFFDDTVQRQV